MIEQWLALTFAMNAVAQTLGQEALYPFVLAPAVMRKLEYVRGRIASVQNVSATPNAAPGAQPPPTGPALAHGSR